MWSSAGQLLPALWVFCSPIAGYAARGCFFLLQYDGSCWSSSAVDLFCFRVACPDGVVPFLPRRPQGSSHGLVPGLLLGTNCP